MNDAINPGVFERIHRDFFRRKDEKDFSNASMPGSGMHLYASRGMGGWRNRNPTAFCQSIKRYSGYGKNNFHYRKKLLLQHFHQNW